MADKHIDLDRQFQRASDDDNRPFRDLFGARYGHLGWTELHEMPRVVILAEAGSGKSSEFKRQRELLAAEDKIAFCPSVSAVARSGLEGALVPAERRRFDAWKSEADRPLWLFVDSVDEAKDQGQHFEDAAKHIADAIAGREERVRLVISSRFTDWDIAADGTIMEKWLAMPVPPPEPATAFEDEVRATLQNRSKQDKPAPAEPIAVLRLSELDRPRVRQFAVASQIGDVDKLLDAIEAGDLWRFAARPLDLGWIVEFWRTHGRLGTLREMIEESIAARLIDPDPTRRRKDPLDRTRSEAALDRIGAGFLFCGKDSLRIPSVGIDLAAPDTAIPIETLLPDWPDGQRLLLLGRPVFDPATLGRARLHNDNEGTLRCFLAARWLSRLLDNGCPIPVIHDLLFADLYGDKLVRPDMVETAAWLASFNSAVAEALIERSPFTLISKGDPGSLEIATRVKAFAAVVGTVAGIDHEKLFLIDRSLRRFAEPALDAHVAGWWALAGADTEAQHLVLRLARLGKLPAGLGIARLAASDLEAEEITQLLACRILLEMGSADDKVRFAQHVVANAATLPRTLILEALSGLTPDPISVEAFFSLIDSVGVRDESGHRSILPIDGDLIASIHTQADLQSFVDHVVARSGELRGEGEPNDAIRFREAFAQLAAAAASKLLDYHPDQVPEAVTDLVMLLHEAHRYSDAEVALTEVNAKIRASAGRRQTSYWRATELARAHPWNKSMDDVNAWSLGFLGWPVTLDENDLAWLLADARDRPNPRDRLNALGMAHQLWRQIGGDPALLTRIREAVAADAVLSEQLDRWQAPQVENPAIAEQMARLKSLESRNREQGEKRESSWVELLSSLKADPSVFDHLNPQTEETVDSRLFHLWQFVSWRVQSRSRYAIDSLDIVEPIFGPELTRKFGDALIAFAEVRARTRIDEPIDTAPRSNFDLMALGGTALAAATRPNWALQLTAPQAAEAVRLATFELNGFPDYLSALAQVRPEVVREMLFKRAAAQLDAGKAEGHGMLDRLEYADANLTHLIADDLTTYLADHPELPAAMLEKIVSVLLRALPTDPTRLQALAAERAHAAADVATTAYYLLLLFAVAGDGAVDAFRDEMASLAPADQTVLCGALLPRVVGSRYSRGAAVRQTFAVTRLEQMLLLAFQGIRVSEDIKRPDGEAYSVGERDEAEDARNAIFNRILETPGEATQAVLRRLMGIPEFPIKPEWLRLHAFRRAERDAILAPWAAGDVLNMERTHDRAPTTTADLQLLARRRLEATTHDLFHGKNSQGDTVQTLADEGAVQRWVANQLEERKKDSYTVQRETEVADAKAPDIMLTSRHTGVDLPIEIKVVDRMTVAELEAALVTQLCGQYLRHQASRHGILLLVYQQPRAGGWTLREGEPLISFDAVLEHLHDVARTIRESSATGPQPIIVAIDVSTVISLKAKRAAARTRTAAKKAASKTGKGKAA